MHSGDGPGEYPKTTSCYAGETKAMDLPPKSVAYITTGSNDEISVRNQFAGAPVPHGADAVVQIEDTEFLGEREGTEYVKIKIAAQPGLDIRPLGSDIELNRFTFHLKSSGMIELELKLWERDI